jgi:hypothetical protein
VSCMGKSMLKVIHILARDGVSCMGKSVLKGVHILVRDGVSCMGFILTRYGVFY